MPDKLPVTLRFAPSPNGRLHLGHAYSALLNARIAEKLGGRLLLRLEDIDTVRCTPQLSQQCMEDLTWLGIWWQGEVRVQSQHFADYAKVLAPLQHKGLAYPCFCTRSQVAHSSRRTDPDGAPLYPGTCTQLRPDEVAGRIAQGCAHSWRLDMAKALEAAPGPYAYARFDPQSMRDEQAEAWPQLWGDVILSRKDTPSSYHLSVVVDDALQGISHIVRGVDLEAATGLHVLLQRLLGLPTPLYHHHALLTDLTGGKLSKSKGSESLADLRARGITAQAVRGLLESNNLITN